MASRIPKEVKLEIVTRWLPATEPTWKVALFLSTSNCNTDGVLLYSACTNEVASGGGYTTAGETLTGRAVAYIETTNARIDADDTPWTSATFTARYAVVYETATSKIRAVYDFLADKSVTGGTFTIQWNASGLCKIS